MNSSSAAEDKEAEESVQKVMQNMIQDKENKKDDTTEPVSAGKQKLRSWLNKTLKIDMTDGRVVNGNFLCTDRDGNVILGSCCEYLKPEISGTREEEPRVLGLVMVPGRHIVSIHLDVSNFRKDIT